MSYALTMAYLGAALSRMDPANDDEMLRDARAWLAGEMTPRSSQYWNQLAEIERFERGEWWKNDFEPKN